MFNDHIDGYIIHKRYLLGKGAFAEVYLAQNEKTEELCAVKITNKGKIEDGKQELKILQRIKMINSDYLLRVFDYKVTSSRVYIFMEKMDFSLEDLLKKERMLPESEALYYFHQIILGISDIHTANMIHRDIKPDNVFLRGNKVYIGDFNISSETSVRSSTLGTPHYMSPEMLNAHMAKDAGARFYGPSIDLWAAGIIFYEMLFGKKPFDAKVSEKKKFFPEMMRLIKKSTGENLYFPEPNNVTQATKNLLKRMLNWESAAKLNAGLILKSECFQRFNEKISTASILQSEKGRESILLKSQIMTASVVVSRNKSTYTRDMDHRLLCEKLDMIVVNQQNRNVLLAEIVNFIAFLIQNLFRKRASDPAGYKKVRPFVKELFEFGLLLRAKLFFNTRFIEKALGNRKTANEMLKRNAHISQGDITEEQWKTLTEKGEEYFKTEIYAMSIAKNEVINDMEREKKNFKMQFGEKEMTFLKSMFKLVDHRKEKEFQTHYLIKSTELLQSTVNMIDKLDDNKLYTIAQDIVSWTYYFNREESKDRIDWERFKVKIENLPLEKHYEVNRRILALKTSPPLKNYLFPIALIVLLIGILLKMVVFQN